jgi:MoxR-like ATPase
MKINKILVEDIEEVVTDPASDSVEEIADEIQDAAAASDGEITSISDDDAFGLAAEMKEVGQKIGAEEAIFLPYAEGESTAIGTKNVITDLLDRALEYALESQKLGEHSMGNVLISGLPGSGKTAIVEDWAASRNLNLIDINAKDNDLEAFINGFTVRDLENSKQVTKAYSNALDKLKDETKNSIIFLDELNRQTKDQVRGSLLTLVNNKTIQADTPSGKYYFKNLLFTVACINPHLKSDPGAASLFQAEKTRYLFKNKNAHSDSRTTDDFLLKYFDKAIKRLNPKHADYRTNLERYLRIQHLGRFIVGHRIFEYDGEGAKGTDELQAMLQALEMEDADMFNQRMLFELLKASRGKVDMFRTLLDSSDFLEERMEMLREILDEYHEPKFEDLAAAKGIDLSQAAPAIVAQPEDASDAESAGESEDDEDEINFDDYEEDDDDFFTSGTSAGSTFAPTPTVVKDKIKAALANW